MTNFEPVVPSFDPVLQPIGYKLAAELLFVEDPRSEPGKTPEAPVWPLPEAESDVSWFVPPEDADDAEPLDYLVRRAS